MKAFAKGLDSETQLLVATGAAIAAGCIPCLESITKLAQAEGIDPKKMKSAAIVGQFVKEQPAAHMKAAADRLLGTHLQADRSAIDCPAESTAPEAASADIRHNGCGCSADCRAARDVGICRPGR